MSDEIHHVHHRGSPRYDSSPDGGCLPWIGICVLIWAISSIGAAFWHAIFGIVLGLIGIVVIWRYLLPKYVLPVAKPALSFRLAMWRFNRGVTQCRNRQGELDSLEAKKAILSPGDYNEARSHAVARFNNAVDELHAECTNISGILNGPRCRLQDKRQLVLERAPKLKESGLKDAIAMLDNEGKRLDELLNGVSLAASEWRRVI